MARSAVLFVDDEPAVLEGIELVFRREASEVLTATSARDALEILASRRVDVVVSDECMPQVSGAEFLATVAERYPKSFVSCSPATLRSAQQRERSTAACLAS